MTAAPAPAALFAATLLLAGCGTADAPEPPTDAEVKVEKTVVLKADSKTGEIGIDLPGGTGATLRLPPELVDRMGKDSKVDIDGVGLYPGARITEIAATSRERGAVKDSRATIRFTAPSTPEAVGEWYVAAFRDKGHEARRTGNRVEGKTTEGSTFTLDLVAEGSGAAGTLVVTDTKG